MHVQGVDSEQDLAAIKSLFREYFTWVSQDQGLDLGYQGIEDELSTLPGEFSSPAGCLLLAEVDGCAAGCVALRPLDGEICEMKRMYVRPEYRGTGVGRALAAQIIHEARDRGYRAMRLDTADTMKAAQGLYASFGFQEIPPYNQLPAGIQSRAVFMELSLQ